MNEICKYSPIFDFKEYQEEKCPVCFTEVKEENPSQKKWLGHKDPKDLTKFAHLIHVECLNKIIQHPIENRCLSCQLPIVVPLNRIGKLGSLLTKQSTLITRIFCSCLATYYLYKAIPPVLNYGKISYEFPFFAGIFGGQILGDNLLSPKIVLSTGPLLLSLFSWSFANLVIQSFPLNDFVKTLCLATLMKVVTVAVHYNYWNILIEIDNDLRSTILYSAVALGTLSMILSDGSKEEFLLNQYTLMLGTSFSTIVFSMFRTSIESLGNRCVKLGSGF